MAPFDSDRKRMSIVVLMNQPADAHLRAPDGPDAAAWCTSDEAIAAQRIDQITCGDAPPHAGTD
jgi:magnesium-transporting ATPase (P-type)